ncbi:MAG: nucleotidyl transferase AbiEii/AbiGii toxin family protein [Acidimicrobiales bacterium]
MLSDLQLRVARIIAGLTEAEDFALAGGAALIVHGDVERATRDLDFFGTSPDAVARLVPAAELALQEAGFQVDRFIDSPGFTRFVVTDQLERTEVDLASDARLLPTEAGPGFELLSSEELAADKVLAVFGRAEARDYVDLMSIEPRFGLARLFELAHEKDRGFSPAAFTEMLDRFPRLPRDEFPIDDIQFEELKFRVQVWRAGALELSSPEERSTELGRDRDTGIDLGY